MLAKTLPHTCTVLGPQGLQEVVHAYWRAQLPYGYYYKEEACRFGAYVLTQLQQGQMQYRFLEEVLRLELAMLELAGLPRERITPHGRCNLGDPEACVPTLHPLCRLVSFCHDPETLLTALRQGHTPEHIASGTYYWLLDRSSSEQLHIKQVTVELGAFLSTCDGHRSVAQLCNQWLYTIADVDALAEAGYLIFEKKAPGQDLPMQVCQRG